MDLNKTKKAAQEKLEKLKHSEKLEKLKELKNIKSANLSKKQKKKIILIAALALVLIIGLIILLNVLSKGSGSESAGVMRYRFNKITTGEVNSTISGSGTLSAVTTQTVVAAGDGTITAVYKKAGDTVQKGDRIMDFSCETAKSDLADMYSELKTLQTKMAAATTTRSSLKITAPRAGYVKDIQCSVGDSAEDYSYLCKISTDSMMKVKIAETDNMKRYQTVQVIVNNETVEGTIQDITDCVASVVFEDNLYSVGTPATVKSLTGEELGSGTVECNEHIVVPASSGCIAEVLVTDNQKVSKNTVLFNYAEGTYTEAYTSYIQQEKELKKKIDDLENTLTVKATMDGLVASIAGNVGDEITASSTLCVVTDGSGYTITLGIDELDIGTISIGQDATITLDAIDGEFSGKVTNISYSGSGSYVTSYTTTVTTEQIEGALPGMSATAEIITQSSGDSLVVPVSAVQYEGDNKFVYLVPENYDQTTKNVDTSKFEKVTVETGMSDGSYIVITGEGLKEGDTICVPSMETTAVYTPDEETTTSFGGFGGMGGGMPGGDMPSGGFPGGSSSGGGFSGGGMPSGGPRG